MRSRLRTLQGRQAATTFSHAWSPPRLRGTTWSMLSAAPPQYWQRWSSRANTERRLSGVFQRYGTRTNRRRRTTDGTATANRGECITASVAWSISAVSPSTSTTARRSLTMHSGSNVALSTSALVIDAPPARRGQATALRRVGRHARRSLADAQPCGGQTTGGATPSVATSATTVGPGTIGGRSGGRRDRRPCPPRRRRPSAGGTGGTRAPATAGTGGGATIPAPPAPTSGAGRSPTTTDAGRRRPLRATPSSARARPSRGRAEAEVEPEAPPADGGRADQRPSVAQPRRQDAGAAGELDPGPRVQLGLGRVEEGGAVAEGHRAGNDREPQVEQVGHRGHRPADQRSDAPADVVAHRLGVEPRCGADRRPRRLRLEAALRAAGTGPATGL